MPQYNKAFIKCKVLYERQNVQVVIYKGKKYVLFLKGDNTYLEHASFKSGVNCGDDYTRYGITTEQQKEIAGI